MEKRKPAFDLRTVKKLAKNPETRIITRQAFKDTTSLGWNEGDIITCIDQLSSQDFYKSMTTYANSRIWQDVYYPTYEEVELYVKVQIGGADENVVIISFKKR